jgi:inner membrane protein
VYSSTVFGALISHLDNLTHSLVGLFLARAGFKNATPRGTAIMVVAANIPDIDVITWVGGAATALRWHRNITHSLIAMPAMAILAVLFVAAWPRPKGDPGTGAPKIRWMRAWLIALVALASHLILDLTNVYGVRLVLPFSGHWTHWDLTPVVDFTIWAILLTGVVAPALSRLVGSEIGESVRGKGHAGWAVTSLLLLAGYNYSRSVLHDHATARIAAHNYNRLAPRRVGAFPTANPLVWRGMAELSNAYVEVPADLRTTFRPADAATYYKPPRTPAMRAAMTTYAFQALLEFVQYPLWVERPSIDAPGDTRVSLVDLRFGTPSQAGFAATAKVDGNNRVLESAFGIGQVRPR